MSSTNHYFPEGLEWYTQGNLCRVRDINRMCKNILANGTVTNVHHHTSQSFDPDGTRGVWHGSSQALTVKCDHVPGLMYVIHLDGFRVTEIVEMVNFDEAKA